jgi:hypothetical protein
MALVINVPSLTDALSAALRPAVMSAMSLSYPRRVNTTVVE